MQQLHRQRPSSGASSSRSRGAGAHGGASDAVGNQEMADRVAQEAPEAQLGLPLEFGGATFDDGRPLPTHKGAEVKPGFDPREHATDVREGDRGALIGTGTEVVIRSGKTSRSRELFRVPDGSPAEVVSVSGGAVRVRVRDGEKMRVGWVESSVFTDQPYISKTEDGKDLPEAFQYAYFSGDHSPVDPKGTDTAQGALGDCFFIASMAAVANVAPEVIKDAIQYDPKTGRYKVRFYEETRTGMKPVYIDVDAYLPTDGRANDPAYAGDPGSPLWPAIMEKAYAEFKGGYDVLGEGGNGHQAMAELTGVRSQSKDPTRMKEEDVVPYFVNAMKSGMAIYAGVRNTGTMATQTPLRASGGGAYAGRLPQIHDWNEVEPGTLQISDKGRKVADARDTGEEGDQEADIVGRDVSSGEIQYKQNNVRVAYKNGKSPATASDLEVRYEYHGMLDPAKTLIGNHAYAFEGVVGKDLLQFYNPWGSYQPKPITAAEFLRYFDSLSTNAAPKTKTTK